MDRPDKNRGPARGHSGMPLYTISVTARLTRLPIHTIRWLEANEIFEPARTEGRQRLFSDDDIEFLLEVAQMLERKVNLAGIRTILEVKRTYHIERISLSMDEEEEE
ncbi:MAG: MerR family transcriptional regulator [Elusimicrobiota bacterium]